eukprot:7109859-Alexandrium_andersonii.AAC.1
MGRESPKRGLQNRSNRTWHVPGYRAVLGSGPSRAHPTQRGRPAASGSGWWRRAPPRCPSQPDCLH